MGAVPSPGGLAADQARASVIASQIDAQGRLLDQLSEQADAAAIYQAQVSSRLAGVRAAVASTDAEIVAARAVLRRQALAAYTDAGDYSLVPVDRSGAGASPDLVGAYGEIVSGGERDAVTTYRALRRRQAGDQSALEATLRSTVAAAGTLAADRQAAEATEATQRATLAGLQGQMATLVAAAQAAAAQAAQAEEEQSLSLQHQALPPASPPAPPGTTVAARPGSATTTTNPPTTARPAAAGAPTTIAPAAPGHAAAHPTTMPPAAVTTSPPTTARPAPPAAGPGSGSPPAQAPGAGAALAYAQAQLGKPYQWAGAGPSSFDCSGLVMMAWAQAGVAFPHLAQDQYDMTVREPLADALPGDLVFFGTPSDVYHVGIYIGGGQMIDAPETGQDVSAQGIYWTDLLGAGRVVG